MDIEKGLIKEALEEAAKHHHEYESNILGGTFDEAWADWYGAFMIGRLSQLTKPSLITQSLQMAADMHERDPNREMPWSEFYAEYVRDYFQEVPDESEDLGNTGNEEEGLDG
jgi:hypothetical protein